MQVVDAIFTDSRLLRETLRIVEEVNQKGKNLMEGFTDVGCEFSAIYISTEGCSSCYEL